ncbi:hypothetical protein LIA77_07349 [Sarocladium implicatum]|nr:hypothetical protein LIA77_07349 [Sarocladium implicatum]
MGVPLSAIFKQTTANPSESQGHDNGLERRPSLRSHSRGSSLGPAPSLMYETVPDSHEQPSHCDVTSNSRRPTKLHTGGSDAVPAGSGEQQQSRQEYSPTDKSLDALLDSLRERVVATTSSVPIPQLQHVRLRKRTHDTTATRVGELQEVSSSVSVPYVRPRQDTFGESIRAFPPRKLHAYPSAVRACPTVYMQRSGLFDIDELVAEFGHSCHHFAHRLEALDDLLWHIKQQIRTREDTIARFGDMQSVGECDACEAAQLESHIQRAAREGRRLEQRLRLIRQDAHETILGAFDCQRSTCRSSLVDEGDELPTTIMYTD